MNKDTLKERDWKLEFTKKFSDNIVPGSVANDFIRLHKDCGKELMGFIETLIEQTRKERDEEWKKAINTSASYHLDYDKASAFASDVLLILNTKSND